jgi:hypothetical protein
VQPRKRKSAIAVTIAEPTGTAAAASATGPNSSARKFHHIRNMATRKPKSPMRLTMNAFFPASALAFSVNQKPISR